MARRWPAMAVAAAVLSLHAPGALRGAWFIHRDSLEYTYANDHVLREAVAAGRLPHLNPFVLGGVPHLADPPTQALYAPRWLTLAAPQPWATHLFVIGHALLGALGAAALSRVLGAPRPGQALAGAAYAASGYVLSLQENLPLLAGAAWTPWALTLATRIGRRGDLRARLRPAAGAAVSLAACLLAGDPQAAAVAGALAPLLAACAAPAGQRRAAAGVAAGALAAAGLLAGAALVPAARLVPYTSRSLDFPYEVASLWSTHPWRAVEALVPWPWLADFPALRFAGRGLLEGDRTTFFAETLYVGPLVLLLAAAGLRGGGPARARRALALAAAGCGVLALGRHTPVHELACAALPGLARLRYPEKFLLVPTLAACALAGRGVGSLRGAAGPVALGLAAAALLVVPALVSPLTESSATAPWDVPVIRARMHAGAGRAALVLGLAGAALLLGDRRARAAASPREARRAWRIGVGAVVVVAALDPWLAGRERLFLVRRAPFEPLPPALARARDALASGDQAPGRLAHWPPKVTTPVGAPGEPAELVLRRAVERGAAAWSAGVLTTSGFASWYPRRLSAFVGADPARAWPLLAVQRVLALEGAPPPGADPARADALPGDVVLHGLARTAPVAWLVPRAATARAEDQAQALALVATPGFDPARHTVLEGAPADVAPLAPDAPWPAVATSTGEAAARRTPGADLEVEVQAPEPVTLLVASVHYPGWEAEVDGAPAPVYPASALVLGVPLPPGEHRVRLRFRTPGLAAGLALTAVGVAATGAAVLASRRRRPG